VRVVSDEPPVAEGAGEKQARDGAGAGALAPPRGEHRRNREGGGGDSRPDRGDRAPRGSEAQPDGARNATAPALQPPVKPDDSPKRSEPAQAAGPPRQ